MYKCKKYESKYILQFMVQLAPKSVFRLNNIS